MPTYIQIMDAFFRFMTGLFPSVPTYFRLMEVLSCSIMDFLPYLLLVVYPFRNHIRLKSVLAGLLTLVITPAVLYYDISAAFLGAPPTDLPFPLLRAAALLVLAVLVIRANIGKQLLNTCSVINLSILISAVADRFAADYTAKHLLVTLLLQALLLIPYAFNLVYVLAPTLNQSQKPLWKLLFPAPAAGTAIGCVLLLSGAASLPAVMAASLVLAAAAAALILIFTGTEMIPLIWKKEKTVPQAAPAVADAPMQDPVQTCLTALQQRMLDAEYSYRELLLQVMTMEDDLNNENLAQLREKLTVMRKQLAPQVTPTGNPHIDPVLTYYTRQALLSNIKMATNITLPEMCPVSDEDMTVLLGCLLDSALASCREQGAGTRRIATASHLDDGLLQIGVKHTCATPVDQNSELLTVCRGIVRRYGGKLTVIDMGGVTQIVAVLHI